MRETEKRSIDGHEYTVTQMGFADQRRVLALLTKKLGPGLAVGLGGLLSALGREKGTSVLDLDFEELSQGIVRLIQDLDEADLLVLEEAFGKTSTVRKSDGKTPFLTSDNIGHFRGRMLAYFKWLAFCVEVNYADFFDAARSLRASEPHTSDD